MLKSRQDVYNSLRVLDDYFNRGGESPGRTDGIRDPISHLEAAGHVEALLYTLRPDNDCVRLEFYPKGETHG